jgi:hypothetical protein
MPLTSLKKSQVNKCRQAAVWGKAWSNKRSGVE